MSVRAQLRAIRAVAPRLIRRFYVAFEKAGGLEHSGSIAFFGILSILPFSLLAVGLVARLLASMPSLLGSSSPVDAVLEPLRRAIPFMDDRLEEMVTALANKPSPLSTVSILTLVYAASAGFNATSSAINAMLGTEKTRRFLLTKLLVAALVILSVGGLILWSAVANLVTALASRVDVAIPDWLSHGTVAQSLVEFCVIALGHHVLVRVVATERPRSGFRWLGAFVFSALFLGARVLLGLYLREVASYDRYYGVAGAFFGLSLWMYVVSILLLSSCTLIRLLEALDEEGMFDVWRRRWIMLKFRR